MTTILTGNEIFDRWLMDEMLDAESLVTKMLKGSDEHATTIIVAILETAFDAGRVAGQEDVADAGTDWEFPAPTAH